MQSGLNRITALDGLRGISVLLVMASHLLEVVGRRWVPGGLGVTVFFVISGFVITRLLLRQADRGPIAPGPFYARRFFRLAPALLVYVLLSDTLLRALDRELPWSAIAAALLYYANYYNVFATPLVLDPSGVVSPLVVVWSLAVEEHFYLIYPAVLIALAGRPRMLERVLIAVIVASLAWRCVLVFGTGLDAMPQDRIFMATDTRMDTIAFGCWLAAAMHRAQRPGRAAIARMVQWLGRPSTVAGGLLLLFLTLVIRQEAWRETARYSVQCMALLPLFCALASTRHPLGGVRALLQSAPLQFFGAISYSLYLYHFLGLVLVRLTWPGASPWLQIALAAVLGLSMAVVSYLLIETPLRRAGARWVEGWERRRQAAFPRAAT